MKENKNGKRKGKKEAEIYAEHVTRNSLFATMSSLYLLRNA